MFVICLVHPMFVICWYVQCLLYVWYVQCLLYVWYIQCLLYVWYVQCLLYVGMFNVCYMFGMFNVCYMFGTSNVDINKRSITIIKQCVTIMLHVKLKYSLTNLTELYVEFIWDQWDCSQIVKGESTLPFSNIVGHTFQKLHCSFWNRDTINHQWKVVIISVLCLRKRHPHRFSMVAQWVICAYPDQVVFPNAFPTHNSNHSFRND